MYELPLDYEGSFSHVTRERSIFELVGGRFGDSLDWMPSAVLV